MKKDSKNEKYILTLLNELVKSGLENNLLEKEDYIYVYNRLLNILAIENGISPQSDDFLESPIHNLPSAIPDLIDLVVLWAVEQGFIEDLFDMKEVLAAELMSCMMARPSEINGEFWHLYAKSPDIATDWFYKYCQAVQYIQVRRIRKNISYQADSQYGLLDITINLSKPEKNPADIAAARLVESSDYPACLLCVENEGYRGRINHPARANHRLIRLNNLAGENWFFQYSPYSYYPEHCIVLSGEHRPMKTDKNTFVRILEFLDLFPHYFIGSNADLPIVGGSILSHDHYQGGRYSFAMQRAPIEYIFNWSKYPEVDMGIVKWPMSVIRLSCEAKEQLTDCAVEILNNWRQYNDPEADILSSSNGEPHNTITPIGRIRNNKYELDLVLRNNRQTEEHPMGIFHPHADVHHIKQENIGLIEVMGLAVLPSRLVIELDVIADYLLDDTVEIMQYHAQWAAYLRNKYFKVRDKQHAQEIVRLETALKFEKVLLDAGVFKRDEKGIQAFHRYLNHLTES